MLYRSLVLKSFSPGAFVSIPSTLDAFFSVPHLGVMAATEREQSVTNVAKLFDLEPAVLNGLNLT